MTRCTAAIHVEAGPEEVGAFVSDVHNLPRWTGFFRSVGARVADRHEVTTAMGTTIRTRIERDAERYAISSLIGEREERAELEVVPDGGGARVTFTMTLLPALAAQQADGTDPTERQRERMRGELASLRDVLVAAR
jgi:hypothetical protein